MTPRCILPLTFVLVACAPKKDPSGQETNGSESSEGSTSPTSSASAATESDDGAGSTGSTSEDGTGSTGAVPGENGDRCSEGTECESGFCFQRPMGGGVCSECAQDSDCGMPGTCAPGMAYATCTDGSAGSACDPEMMGCASPLMCVDLVDTMGTFDPITTCSECETDAQCDGGNLCAPSYTTGAKSCVAPGSVANNGGCPVNEDGVTDGSVCESTYCALDELVGVFGVCGECDPETGDGCDAGEECQPPRLSSMAIVGAECMAAGTGSGTETVAETTEASSSTSDSTTTTGTGSTGGATEE